MENWSEYFGIDFEDYFKLEWNLFWDQIGRIEGKIEGADYKYWFLMLSWLKYYD